MSSTEWRKKRLKPKNVVFWCLRNGADGGSTDNNNDNSNAQEDKSINESDKNTKSPSVSEDTRQEKSSSLQKNKEKLTDQNVEEQRPNQNDSDNLSRSKSSDSKQILKFTAYVEHDNKPTNSPSDRKASTPSTEAKLSNDNENQKLANDKPTRQSHKKPNVVEIMPRIDEEDEEEVAFSNNQSQKLENDKPTTAVTPLVLNPQERQVHKKPNVVDKMPRIDEEDEEEVASSNNQKADTSTGISQKPENDKPTMAVTPIALNPQERQVNKKPNIVEKMPRIDEEDEKEVASSSTKNYGTASAGIGKVPEEKISRTSKEVRRSSLTMSDDRAGTGSIRSVASDYNKFCSEFFECHNKYRKLHGVPAFKSSKKLMERAVSRAQYLSENNIRKNDLIEYGECIHIIRGSVVFTAEQIARFWYNQKANFNFATGMPGENTEAFTQMIWKSSREFGCATARAGGCTWIVAIYNPPGNYIDHYKYNVPPAISDNITDQAQASTEKATFVRQCLEAHNKYRKSHSCPPLNLNTTLCDAADEWAKTLAVLKKLKYPENIDYGTNMFEGECAFAITGEQVVKIWYDENAKYDFDAGLYSKKTGHFTQVIWRNTRELGVGYIKTGLLTFVVCYYDPAGNYPGEFLENVPRFGGQPLQTVATAAVSAEPPFEYQVLDAHNNYRKLHGCPPLVLSDELSLVSLQWSKKLFGNSTNVFTFIRSSFVKNRPQITYGENTFYAQNVPNLTGERVVKAWYDEISEFDFKNPKFTVAAAHFTQIVWATTKELGVGITKINNNTWVVCTYNPPGNIVGEYQLNVPKLGSPIFVDPNLNVSFAVQCLNAHNNYRALHGCPPLELNQRLSSFAAHWADILGQLKKMMRRPSNVFGENICMGKGSTVFTGERVVKAWYKEISNYNFDDPKYSNATKHFTQVIWKSTLEMGVSLVKNDDITIVVAYYSPAGNIMGGFAENVPRLIK